MKVQHKTKGFQTELPDKVSKQIQNTAEMTDHGSGEYITFQTKTQQTVINQSYFDSNEEGGLGVRVEDTVDSSVQTEVWEPETVYVEVPVEKIVEKIVYRESPAEPQSVEEKSAGVRKETSPELA